MGTESSSLNKWSPFPVFGPWPVELDLLKVRARAVLTASEKTPQEPGPGNLRFREWGLVRAGAARPVAIPSGETGHMLRELNLMILKSVKAVGHRLLWTTLRLTVGGVSVARMLLVHPARDAPA